MPILLHKPQLFSPFFFRMYKLSLVFLLFVLLFYRKTRKWNFFSPTILLRDTTHDSLSSMQDISHTWDFKTYYFFAHVRVSTQRPQCRLHRSEMLIIWRLDVSVHSKFQCTSGVPSLSMNAGNPRETVPGQRSSRTRVSLWLILLASSHASFLSL